MMRNATLLIVDDNPDNLVVLQGVIGKELPSCDILTAENGEAGLAWVAARPIDCALIDVQMPGMDGIEMCKRLKADEATSRFPVILITAHQSTPEFRAQALEAGADDFISRPIDNVELAAKTKVMLRIKHAEDKLQDINAHLEELVSRRTEALQDSEGRFRRLYERAPLGYQSLDERGCVLDVNQAWLDTLGYSREEVIGKWFGDFLTPEYVEHFRRNFPCFKAAGEIHRVEFEMICKDGSTILVDYDGRIGRDEDGEFDRTHCILHNITERKRAEEALRQSEERYRTLVERSPYGVQETDTSGTIVFANKAHHEMYGYDEEGGLVGRSIAEFLVPGPHRDELSGYLELLVKDQPTPTLYHQEIRTKDGEKRDTEVAWGYLPDGTGGIKGFISVLTDITERKRAEAERAQLEQQLREIQKLDALGQMAAGVAHDFKNLLTAIQGYTELASGMVDAKNHDAQQALGNVQQAVQEAADISQSLLTFSRGVESEKEPLDLGEVVEEGRRLFRQSLPKSIKFEVVCDRKRPLRIVANKTQLHQILLNLLLNARDAMPEGGGVKLAVGIATAEKDRVGEAGPRFAELSVTDTGEGIPPELVDRVFEPFFTTKERGHGTGLGLSLVHGIVKDHRGEIDVQSRVGEGTTFVIRLPLVESEPEEGPATSTRGERIVL